MREIKNAVRTLKKQGGKKEADIYIQYPVAGVKDPMPYQEAWPIIKKFFAEKEKAGD